MKPFNEHNTQPWGFETGQHLHGDVVITKVQELPKDFNSLEKEPKDALAYGEVSGHLHKLFRLDSEGVGGQIPAFDLRVDKDGIKWLKVDAPTVLKHQEHSPRILPAGLYKIGIQREYDVWTRLARNVKD